MKKLVLLCLTILIGGNAFAQNYPSGSVLWKISGNNLEKPSYILGTFHLKSGDYLEKIPGALAAIESCEQVVGELDMSDMPKIQQQMMPAMMMTPDTTYKMLYSEDEYNFVSEKMMPYLGLGLDQMGMLKPSALQTAIVTMMYQKMIPDFDAENPLDIVIQKMGEKSGKPILGLELVSDQIKALYDASSLQRQADLLLCNLQYLDEIEGQAAVKLLKDYENSDLNALYFENFLNEDTPCQSTEEEKNLLLKDRNDKWMEKLPEIMQDKSSFIAVGALHLAGKEGLLHQLIQLGYTVSCVR